MRKNLFLYVLAFVPLVVVPWVPEPYLTPKVILLLLIMDAALVLNWRRLRSLPWCSPLLIVLVVYLVITGVAAVLGVFPNEALGWGSLLRANGWWITVHGVGASLWAYCLLQDARDWKRFFEITTWVAAGIGLLGIVGQIWYHLPIIGYPGSAIGTIGNASFFGGYVLVHFWLTLWLALYQDEGFSSRMRVFGYVMRCLILLGALVRSDSRGALLALVLSIAVGVAAALLRVLRQSTPAQKRYAYGLTVIGYVLVLGYSIAQIPSVRVHLPRAFGINIDAATSQTRRIDWGIAWNAWMKHPVLGWGKTAFASAFGQSYNPAIAKVWHGDIFTDDPHNVFLATAVESGALGLLAYLAIYVVLVWVGVRKMLTAARLQEGWQEAAGLGIITAYVVYSFFTIEQPVVSLFFWVWVGWRLWSYATVRDEDVHVAVQVPWLRITLVGFASVSALIAGYDAVRIVTFAQVSYAQSHARWFTWQDALQSLPQTRAVGLTCTWWEDQTKTWLQVSTSSAIAHDVLTKTADALVAHSSACTYGQNHFVRTFLLGQLYIRLADLRGDAHTYVLANAALERARVLAPQHQQVVYTQAELLVSVHAYDKATELLESWAKKYPDMGETYWYLSLVTSLRGDEKQAQDYRQQAIKNGFTPPTTDL